MTLFGTDGIRAHLSSPLLQENEFKKIIHKIAQWILHTQKNPTILIGRDTRPSGIQLQKWLMHVLSSYPVTVYDAQIIPTPFACALVYTQNPAPFTCGIIITASHNNAEYNGIKLYTPEGKLSEKDEHYIEHVTLPGVLEQKATMHLLSTRQIIDAYTHRIKKHLRPLPAFSKPIVIDCAHGALSSYASQLLAPYGTIISISHPCNGQKVNEACGATYPQTVVQAVKKHDACIGFAFDGDGDRIIAVDHAGTIYDGDDILYLLTHHPQYKNATTYVGTQMSNQGLVHTLKTEHKKFIRTPVGDKHVIASLQKHTLPLGAESSGHVVCNDIGPWADGLTTCIRILETITELKEWPPFTKFEASSYSIPLSPSSPISAKALNALCADALKKLPEGRCVIRKSGTEPVIRVRVEDKNAQHAQHVGEYIKECVYTLMQRN